MEVTELLTAIFPDRVELQKSFLKAHPRVYLSERSGLRSGITRYREWHVLDPDQNYKELAVGATEWDALKAAVLDWMP